MFEQVVREFEGAHFLVLGCGESALNLHPSRVEDFQAAGGIVLCVNRTIRRFRSANAVIFHDTSFFFDYEEYLRMLSCRIYTASRVAKQQMPECRLLNLFHVTRVSKVAGWSVAGNSSGITAAALAAQLGAAKIVLLGFDLREEYTREDDRGAFLAGWKGWGVAMLEAGVCCVNATPESRIGEFAYEHLDTALAAPLAARSFPAAALPSLPSPLLRGTPSVAEGHDLSLRRAPLRP